MSHFKLVLIYILLFSGGITFNVNSSEIELAHANNELAFEFSEDVTSLSPSHLPASTDLFKKRLTSFSNIPVSEGNSREFSKVKRYLAVNRFIEPGLSHTAIIFPFHTFL